MRPEELKGWPIFSSSDAKEGEIVLTTNSRRLVPDGWTDQQQRLDAGCATQQHRSRLLARLFHISWPSRIDRPCNPIAIRFDPVGGCG